MSKKKKPIYLTFRSDNGKLVKLKKGSSYETKYGTITYSSLANSKNQEKRYKKFEKRKKKKQPGFMNTMDRLFG